MHRSFNYRKGKGASVPNAQLPTARWSFPSLLPAHDLNCNDNRNGLTTIRHNSGGLRELLVFVNLRSVLQAQARYYAAATVPWKGIPHELKASLQTPLNPVGATSVFPVPAWGYHLQSIPMPML